MLLENRQRRVPPRAFSIANALAGQADPLLVTRVPDGGDQHLVHERLRVGEEVSTSGPYGIRKRRPKLSRRTRGELTRAYGSLPPQPGPLLRGVAEVPGEQQRRTSAER